MNAFHVLVLSLIALLNTCVNNGNKLQLLATSEDIKMPVFRDVELNKILKFKIIDQGKSSMNDSIFINALSISFEGTTDVADISEIEIYITDSATYDNPTLFGKAEKIANKVTIYGSQVLESRDQHFWLSIAVKDNAVLSNLIQAKITKIQTSAGKIEEIRNGDPNYLHRMGIALRRKLDENVDTYRIPGMATTNSGTLIAVYDIRYNNSKDLQEDVDVGMSRSTDGGQTWEKMQVIMDMGQYGGLPEDENGIGDPAVLVDRETGTIWVAALWLHGKKDQRAWFASEQGMSVEKTGQFMLVKSNDDGKTWSDPINITSQMKKPEWQLFFNGPGKGITMKDGTLVFAAQFKDKDAVPHSTIIYSKDRGTTWTVGTGAKSETTEAQVVELSDGRLMLNMRDNRNAANRKDSINGRSVYITDDMGKTWQKHVSSRSALKESVCMASLIAEEVKGNEILFFSNPNSKTSRTNITIKTSFDQGQTWPLKNQINLHENGSYGYSCLTRVDEEYIGILYEGRGDLFFQKIRIADLIAKE